MSNLAPRIRLFAERYGRSDDFNATRIAKEVGYSEKSARKIASALLADPRVKAIIDSILAERLAETPIRPGRVLEELAALAFSSIDDYSVAKPDQPNAGQVTAKRPEAMRAVKEITIDQWINSRGSLVTKTKLKLHEKTSAVTTAMRYLGMLVEKHEHSGKVQLEELVVRSRDT